MGIAFSEHPFSFYVQIKRPVLELGGGTILVGFKPELYEAAVTARS